jgi:pimeloyl-ACP methyl ester carboxylesterase
MGAIRTRFADDIVADVYIPLRPSNKVVVFAPGMPAETGKKQLGAFLNKKGYWFVEPRYRGTWESDGYFLKGDPTTDISDVVDALQAPFVSLWDKSEVQISAPEVYLLGSSFGGPAVLALSTDSRIKKVVSVSGVIDWNSADTTEANDWLYEQLVPQAFGNAYRYEQTDDWKKLEGGTFYNPVSYGSMAPEKILMIHSEDDTIVPYNTAKEFSIKRGIPLLTLRGQGHAGSSSIMQWKTWRTVKKHFES